MSSRLIFIGLQVSYQSIGGWEAIQATLIPEVFLLATFHGSR